MTYLKNFIKLTFLLGTGILFFAPQTTNAQSKKKTDLYITAKSMEMCYWDADKKSFTKNCSTDKVDALFKFNKNRTTFFVQFDGKGGTTYDIVSSKYEEEYDATLYDIQNGDKLYLLIVDIDDELVKFMPKSGKDSGAYLLMFPVADVYTKK